MVVYLIRLQTTIDFTTLENIANHTIGKMLNIIPRDESQMEAIRKEDFYQPPERVEEDVTQLIEWLNKQPHLPNISGKF